MQQKQQILIILLSIFFISSNLFSQAGFFLDDWASKNITSPSEYTEFEKPTGKADIFVTVDFADTVNKVSRYIFGNNANIYTTQMWNNEKLMNNISNLNPHVIRFPGGNISNEYFWDRELNDYPDDIPISGDAPNNLNPWYGKNDGDWTMSLESYYKVLEKVNATGIICVNYGYARYGTSDDPVAQAAHYAADWVRYDNGRSKFWEIGNENYGSWNKGYEIDTSQNKDGQAQFISGKIYGEQALIFADSMRTAAEEIGVEIFIGFQAYEEEASWDAIQTNWNETMMPVVGDVPDFYIVHSYYTPYEQNTSATSILTSYSETKDFGKQVNKDLSDAGLDPKPIALTEYNIFAEGSGQQISHINGMHTSLILGETIKQGFGLATRWDLANGYVYSADSVLTHGSDHGTFSKGYPGVDDFIPYPAFYHMTFFQNYCGDVMVNSVASRGDFNQENIIPYVTSFVSGQAGIVLINKTKTDKLVELDLENYNTGERVYWYQIEDGIGDGSFLPKVFINSESSEIEVGGPEDYLSVKPYSFEISDTIKVICPAFGAIYMLIDGETVVSVEDEKEINIIDDFQLYQNYPNPFNPSTAISYQISDFSKVQLKVFNVLGKEVATLVNQEQAKGKYKVLFDASNLPSGVYFYRLTYGAKSIAKKMILLK